MLPVTGPIWVSENPTPYKFLLVSTPNWYAPTLGTTPVLLTLTTGPVFIKLSTLFF